MKSFGNYIKEHDSELKDGINKVCSKLKITSQFLGYYIENNDYTYNDSAKPIYESIEEYYKNNPQYGIMEHIRYFFNLKLGYKEHKLSVHLNDNDFELVLFSIEELSEEVNIKNLKITQSYEVIIPMVSRKFFPYIEKIEKNHETILSHGKIDEKTLNKINYKLRLDWNYYSNRMEGGTLTKPETRQVMAGIGVGSKPLDDVKEMSGHDKAVQEILHIAKGNIRISEKRIKDFHKLIMSSDKEKVAKNFGEWKQKNNKVINHRLETQVYLPFDEVPEAMHSLLNKTNSELDAFFRNDKSKKHPLYIASDFHMDYLYIHPFDDGNGRTVRLLTNLILISTGYPPIIINDNTKESYYHLVSEVQSYGADKELFYEFMAEQLIKTQQLVLDAIAGKDIEDDDDLEKRLEFLRRMTDEKESSIKVTKDEVEPNNFIQKNLIPLLRAIYSKYVKLEPLFVESVIISMVNGDIITGKSLEELSNHLNVLTKNWTPELDVYRLKIAHNYLKQGGTKELNYDYDFQISMLKNKYNSSTNFHANIPLINHLYDQDITEEEISNVSKDYLKRGLDTIEEHLKHL